MYIQNFRPLRHMIATLPDSWTAGQLAGLLENKAKSARWGFAELGNKLRSVILPASKQVKQRKFFFCIKRC